MDREEVWTNGIEPMALNLARLVEQVYDGAAFMSSSRLGVTGGVIKSKSIPADNYHCALQCLNLSASEAIKIPQARHCLDVIRNICVFSEYAKRSEYLKCIIKNTPAQL